MLVSPSSALPCSILYNRDILCYPYPQKLFIKKTKTKISSVRKIAKIFIAKSEQQQNYGFLTWGKFHNFLFSIFLMSQGGWFGNSMGRNGNILRIYGPYEDNTLAWEALIIILLKHLQQKNKDVILWAP